VDDYYTFLAQLACSTDAGIREQAYAELIKVGPHGYIHGWIKVGPGTVGEQVHHPDHGPGTVVRVTPKRSMIDFVSGAQHSFEHGGTGQGHFIHRSGGIQTAQARQRDIDTASIAGAALRELTTEHANALSHGMSREETADYVSERVLSAIHHARSLVRADNPTGLDRVEAAAHAKDLPALQAAVEDMAHRGGVKTVGKPFGTVKFNPAKHRMLTGEHPPVGTVVLVHTPAVTYRRGVETIQLQPAVVHEDTDPALARQVRAKVRATAAAHAATGRAKPAASGGSRWKPTMTREEADTWAANSKISYDLYHGTTPAAAESIRRDGFTVEKSGSMTDQGNLGQGIYFSPSSSMAYGSAGKYGETLTVRANVDNPLMTSSREFARQDALAVVVDVRASQGEAMGERMLNSPAHVSALGTWQPPDGMTNRELIGHVGSGQMRKYVELQQDRGGPAVRRQIALDNGNDAIVWTFPGTNLPDRPAGAEQVYEVSVLDPGKITVVGDGAGSARRLARLAAAHARDLPARSMTEIAARLSASPSRAEAEQVLAGLTRPQLKAVAERVGVRLPPREKKAQHVGLLVGYIHPEAATVGAAMGGTDMRGSPGDRWSIFSHHPGAVARRAAIDRARPVAGALSRIHQAVANGMSAEGFRSNVAAHVGRGALTQAEANRIADAYQRGGPSQTWGVLGQIEAAHGLIRIGDAEQGTARVLQIHAPIGGHVPAGRRVTVVRPGYRINHGGEDIIIDRAAVVE
jgi:hypothetical protein